LVTWNFSHEVKQGSKQVGHWVIWFFWSYSLKFKRRTKFKEAIKVIGSFGFLVTWNFSHEVKQGSKQVEGHWVICFFWSHSLKFKRKTNVN
jgi:hypothetical protein